MLSRNLITVVVKNINKTHFCTTARYKQIPIIRHFRAVFSHVFIRRKYDGFFRFSNKNAQKYGLKQHIAQDNTI